MMHYTLFGESHGPAVGVLLTDVPPGLPVDEVFIREQLLRRMGQGGLTTARQEKEEVRFLSGAYQGRTTGDPLAAVIYNGDVRSADYDSLKHKPRPSHGDYTAAGPRPGLQRSPGRRPYLRAAHRAADRGRRAGDHIPEDGPYRRSRGCPG